MNIETALQIHDFLCDYYKSSSDPVSPPGVKNMELLESACVRPFTTIGGTDAFETVHKKAAVLLHAVISNHCFHNGNKRTALLSTLHFLNAYNFWLDRCDNDEMFDFVRKIAAHEICENRADELDTITKWLEKYSRKVQKGDKNLSYISLKYSLSQFNYQLNLNGNYAEIIDVNGKVVETILKKGLQGFPDYDQQYIAELRKKLSLTPEHGIDSARFYGQKGLNEELNEFMILRAEVFDKLAKI